MSTESYKIRNRDFLLTDLSFFSWPSIFRDEEGDRLETLEENFRKASQFFAQSIVYLKDLDRPLFQSEEENMLSSLKNLLDLHNLLQKRKTK